MRHLGIFFTALMVSSVVSNVAWSRVRPKVVYGADNRREVSEVANTFYSELARSTAAMVAQDSIELDDNKSTYKMKSGIKSLRDSLKLCKSERFGDQPFLATCSGFLVAPNVIATAGHCYQGVMKTACDDHVWVFDYKVDDASKPFEHTFNQENVYRCKKVLKAVLSSTDKLDFALIELDRPVGDRLPLKYRKEGTPKVGEGLTVIGHPWGLPSKVANGAKVLFNDNPVYLTGNLDTFQGNSGSAVFNSETGLVEGILVRGRSDATLSFDEASNSVCRVVNTCNEDGTQCAVKDPRSKGEDVTRFTLVAKELEKLGL